MNQTNLNDLSLKSLYEISLSKWKVITYTVTFFAVTSIIYSLFATPIYRSTAVIEVRDQELPSMESGSSSAAGLASLAGFNLQSKTKETYALEVLKSRKLYEHIFLNYDLKKEVFAAKSYDFRKDKLVYDSSIYSEKKKKWSRPPSRTADGSPSMLELHEKVIEDLVKFRFNEKTGFIVVGVDHYSPKFAQEFLMLVIKEANEITRNQDITEAKKVTEYLQELLPRTNDVIVKTSLGKLISNNIRTLAIADSRDDYLLKIIDDPYVPEVRAWPNRRLIVIGSTVFGLIVSFIYILFISYFRSDI